MYTLEGLDKEYVKKIYQNTVLYSIFKYNELDESLKPRYKKRYNNALESKDKLGIIEEKNDLVFTIEEIEKFSKFNNISNDEKYERLWYILIYIAIHYNVLKHKLYL